MIPILISLVALLFSAISLTISYRQFNANKEHQGLTLRPYLNMMHSLDALVSEDLPVTLVWTIKLSNTGLGPALIEEFEIYRDGERVTPDGKRQWQAIAEGFKDKYGIQCHYKFFDLAKNYCVEKSAVIDLLTVSVDDLGDTKNRLAEAVCNCRIVIRYKSFNGQQHVFDSDDNKTTPEKLFS
jgi:hypothetical protein